MSKWKELAAVIYGRETTFEETREVKLKLGMPTRKHEWKAP